MTTQTEGAEFREAFRAGQQTIIETSIEDIPVYIIPHDTKIVVSKEMFI